MASLELEVKYWANFKKLSIDHYRLSCAHQPLVVCATCSVQGISVDGTAVPLPATEPYNVGDRQPARPEGDLPWDDTLYDAGRGGPQSRPVAAHLLSLMREGTAKLLGVPPPPPLQPLSSKGAASSSSSSESSSSSSAAPSSSSSSLSSSAAEPTDALSSSSFSHADGDAGGRRSSRAAAAAASSKMSSSSPAKKKPAAASSSSSSSSSSAAAHDDAGGDADDDVTGVTDSSAAAASAGGGGSAAAAAVLSKRASVPGCGLTSAALLTAHPSAGLWEPLAGGGSSSSGKAGRASSSSSSSSSGSNGVRDPKSLTRLSVSSPGQVMKVTPERIFSVAFHPAEDRLIALAGDKHGRLGVWVPQADRPSAAPGSSSGSASAAGGGSGSARKRARKAAGGDGDDDDGAEEEIASSSSAANNDEEDGDDDDGGHTVALFHLHSSPISYVIVPPGAPHTVLTSSYDGSVRALDLNKGHSWCLTTVGDDTTKGISALAVDAVAPLGQDDSGVLLWCGSGEGAAYHVDSRTGVSDRAPHWQAHDKKITAVSTLRGGHALLTSSSDGTVKIWDARKLPRHSDSDSGGHHHGGNKPHKASPIGTLKHGAAVSSAFFAHHGRHVVSTCNDNKLRVWDVTTSSSSSSASPVHDPPVAVVFHDNHTGRWLSQFRTVFDPANDGTFIVGAMDRALEVYDAPTGARLAALRCPDFVTAVPTLNAVHPSPNVHAIVSGTASGRMYLWT